MTHHTDAEQLHQLLELVLTELDRKAIPIAYMQEIDRKGKAFIEQAARRAPVVPQRCDLCKNNGGYFYGRTGYEPCCVGSLAPQPPDAAPVQMPEYGIDTANHAGIRVRGYTEQQVRELLANHGIQEQST